MTITYLGLKGKMQLMVPQVRAVLVQVTWQMLCVACLFLLGEVPSTMNQRVDGRTVYVNKATRTENSAMDHATKQRPHVFELELFIVKKFVFLCSITARCLVPDYFERI